MNFKKQNDMTEQQGRNLKKLEIRKNLGRGADVLFVLALAAFAFWVNRGIHIDGLYMDDLYMWSCYGEQNLMEFAFPIGTSTRFRPVYWLATYLQMAIIGNHVNWFVPFNILCNCAVAVLLYDIGKRVSGCRVLSFGAGLCYLASRFAYYQIGQALGLMETMALFLALCILYLLYRYLHFTEAGEAAANVKASAGNAKPGAGQRLHRVRQWFVWMKNSRSGGFYLALVLYFLLVFVHERFLSLLPLFYFVLLCRVLQCRRGEKRTYLRQTLRLWIAPAVLLLVIILIRQLCIGTALPAGTGGTEVTDTFSLRQAIGFAWSQVLYIFGVNAGPEHLNGLPWEQTPVLVKAYIKISVIALGVICAMYGLVMLLMMGSKEQADRRAFWESFCTALLFLGFIAMCIGCSSVTIRVEMRWVYVSYAAALLFGIYMIRVVKETYARAYQRSRRDAGDLGTIAAVGAAAAGTETEAEPKLTPEQKSEREEALAAQHAARPRGMAAQSLAAVDEAASAEAKERKLTPEEEALLRRERQGNIFQRSSISFADRIMHPQVLAVVMALVFAVYCALSIGTNLYERQFFSKLYFWPDQLRMNSLAEETIEKYGRDGVFGKDIYILGNTYGMSRFYADTFFKPFDRDKKAEGTTVHFIERSGEIPQSVRDGGKLIVLEEVPEENAYRDVTDEVLSGKTIEAEMPESEQQADSETD